MSPTPILAITLLVLVSAALQPSGQTTLSQNEAQSPTTTTFCDLVKAPERYDKLLVRTKAILLEGPEHSILYDPGCIDSRNLTWFEWEGYTRALKAADKNVQKKLSKYIKSDDRAMLTVVGTFQAKPDVEAPKNVSPEVTGVIKRNNEKAGFGHLGCCPYQLVPTVIEKAERVPKSAPLP
jgi:hypothetical protein